MAKVPLTEFGHLELVEYFEYLDELRESGATNMFGARPYLQEDHGLDRGEASAILTAWMETFDGSSPAYVRVDKALAEQVAS